MANVSIDSLRKVFSGRNEVVAIDDVDLEIETGELLVLLGPSGCGKTTMLRSLAGLETPDAGRISIGEATVYDSARGIHLPPERRDIGMVFQSYALWPHKSVRDNIGFPLEARKLRDQRRSGRWVEEAAELVDCGQLLDRYPSQLSGGQQQRVAVARGIVARPRVVLMDEPLSNLDARLRDQVRGELHELHEQLGFTGVYVTHDQTEALALGDRLAVMRAGAIEHLGPPVEVFEEPRTRYVADFVGFLNGIDAAWQDGRAVTSSGGTLSGVEHFLPDDRSTCELRVRPDDLEVLPDGERKDHHVHLDGMTVGDLSFMGRHVEVRLRRAPLALRANVPCRSGRVARHIATGATVTVAFAHDRCQVYDAEGTRVPVGARQTT